MALQAQVDRFSPRRLFRLGPLLAWVIATLVGCGSEGPAGPKIHAENVWARPAVASEEMSGMSDTGDTAMGHAQSGTSAVYMTLVNEGREAERLIRARTELAEVAEIHETRMEGEVMKMQHLPDGLEIPAGGEVELKPGGYHIMLIGLKRDLNEGDRFTVVLEFEKRGPLTVEVQVRQP